MRFFIISNVGIVRFDCTYTYEERKRTHSKILVPMLIFIPATFFLQEVCSQIYATLYDYPSLKQCEGLRNYIESCIHTAWGLSVQRPPFTLLYDSKVFQPDLHIRAEPSNNQSILIQNILWPALLQTNHGPCVHRAIVQT